MVTTPVDELLQRFHTATGSDDWKIRRECAVALEELFAAESPEVLAQRFSEIGPHDYQLQQAIASALGRSGHPTAFTTLLQLEKFALNRSVVTTIEEALACHLLQESIDTLLERYYKTVGVERQAILGALRQLLLHESTETLLDRLAVPEPAEIAFKVWPQVHDTIAALLKRRFAEDSPSCLLRRLEQLPDNGDYDTVRSDLLQLLTPFFIQEDVEALLRRFDEARGAHARELLSTLLVALGIKADRGVVLPLIQRLTQVRSAEGFYVQLEIIGTLGKLGDSRAIESLLTWFDKPDPYFTFPCDRTRETMVLRQRIVAALGAIGDPAVLDWLQARAFVLRNPEWELGKETLAKTLSTLKAKRQV